MAARRKLAQRPRPALVTAAALRSGGATTRWQERGKDRGGLIFVFRDDFAPLVPVPGHRVRPAAGAAPEKTEFASRPSRPGFGGERGKVRDGPNAPATLG